MSAREADAGRVDSDALDDDGRCHAARSAHGDEAELLVLALELVEDGAVALVEWGDVAPDVLGVNRLTVEIAVGNGDDDRIITLDSGGSSLEAGVLAAALTRWVSP